MKISSKGRYAIRVMIDLAEHNNGNYISSKDIADRQDISRKYLEQIMTSLCKIGYLKSLRGSQGGYKLVKSLSEYTVGDILRITEGDLAAISYLSDENDQREDYDNSMIVNLWNGLHEAINNYVDSITIADLVENKNTLS